MRNDFHFSFLYKHNIVRLSEMSPEEYKAEISNRTLGWTKLTTPAEKLELLNGPKGLIRLAKDMLKKLNESASKSKHPEYALMGVNTEAKQLTKEAVALKEHRREFTKQFTTAYRAKNGTPTEPNEHFGHMMKEANMVWFDLGKTKQRRPDGFSASIQSHFNHTSIPLQSHVSKGVGKAQLAKSLARMRGTTKKKKEAKKTTRTKKIRKEE